MSDLTPAELAVMNMVNSIWGKYDTDNGGTLNKEETRAFVVDTMGGVKGGFNMSEFD